MANDPNVILEQLAKDVEAAVHAMYRGEVRQATARAKTGQFLSAAKAAMAQALGAAGAAGGVAAERPKTPVAVSPRTSAQAPVVVGAAAGWSPAEADAVMRCINAWLPMGSPASTLPETKCIPAGKMLVPSYGERELAREAVRRLA
ncbi:MAG: hypothetical protein HYR75_03980 [Gemmatimonadetes bacterium]|nr:hypothetical protein [Gemmatimonadota bacterium]MBI3568618.1 hypothetical protein [Gemmatimonadota bacterium]